jgi:UDPglucose 6-dehydrogenase
MRSSASTSTPARSRSSRPGRPPFFEPGLPEVLASARETGRLRFSTEIADAADATVHFVAVGTPQSRDGNAADLRFVDAAIEALLPHLKEGDLVVGKSTVPVGTARRLAARVERRDRAPDSHGTRSSCARATP